MDRKLIDYLPPVIKNAAEFEAIMEAIQPEFVDVETAIINAFNDTFVNDATEVGVKRWEAILNIVPKSVDTLEDRKFRILARLNEQLPYTFRSLDDRLITLCGQNGFTMELFNDIYTLKVRIELVVKGQYEAVEQLLKRIVPANLVIDLDLRYNQHEKLKNYTHGQLSAFTHSHIRNEVLT